MPPGKGACSSGWDSVITHTVNGTPVFVRYFMMEAGGRGLRHDKDRQHRWLPQDEARATASHPESSELLRTADPRREAIERATAALATHPATGETDPSPTTND